MFVLKKDWRDSALGIDMVQIHFTWTRPGEMPDWDRLEETRTLQVVPGTSPAYRFCGLELPDRVEGAEQYDLHHFFFYVQGGRGQVSPTYTEAIASQEVAYEDRRGEHTLVGIRWTIGDWSVSNYTLLSLDGLDLQLPSYQNPYTPEGMPSGGLEFPYIYEFVNSCPLPRVFRGKVQGPRGALVQYDWHLMTRGAPRADQDKEVWDTNQAQHWQVTIG
jgi:hypothetical protein